ncbi:MAG: 16S rRNA (cytosine(967)-C(5))-methyltransferase RsmB [Candidatus Latescibacterota bacterium]
MRRRDDLARTAALQLLDSWEGSNAPIDDLLSDLDASLSDDRDRRFARQLVLGTLRWRLRLDWIVGHFSRRPVDELDVRVLNILRMGILQISVLDRVPERAAIHTSVELAKRQGVRSASGLINAVLRSFQREPHRVQYPDPEAESVRHLSLYYSHPIWLVERWMERWGLEKTRDMLIRNNEYAPLWLRINPLRSTSAALCAELRLEPGPENYFRALDPRQALNSAAFNKGHFQVQDPSAGLAVALLDPQPGERILDACSAPGGKTAQIAERMLDKGLIVAADLSHVRLRLLRENTQRLALKSIHPVTWDGSVTSGNLFDRVLVDAPCSGTGTLGRHPDARWNRAPEQFPLLIERQQSILAAAFAQLRPGGTLVYSTCSLEHMENEAIIEHFISHTPDAQIEEAHRSLPDDARVGRYVQTVPGQHLGDGAFAARIHRVKS